MPRVVVAGAGIAGISTAFHLVRAGIRDVVVADPRAPLTLTSDKSTECYRNWWPNEPMIRLMQRSIELMDDYARESGNIFDLNRRGYLYLTADEGNLRAMVAQAEAASAAGAGPLRTHRGPAAEYLASLDTDFAGAPDGADLFLETKSVLRHFPFVSERVVGGLHARTAGWLSAQQFGMWLLEQASSAGVAFVKAEVTRVEHDSDRIAAVELDDGSRLETSAFVNATGPHLRRVGRLVGVDLPVQSEVHAKTAFRDHLGCFPRDAPMVIWNDPQSLGWSNEECDYLEEAGRTDLLGELPPGCHGRPEGGAASPWALGLWEYHTEVREPEWPVPTDPLYAEVVLRGLANIIPGLEPYADALPHTVVDAGYYTKTKENLPLAGPIGPAGSYVCGALSGFGIMAACAVGELVARAIAGTDLPTWSRWFELSRYDDPSYVARLATLTDSGQL
jgi:glycine/D-amino acid oxidase-like deaminating enzyme